ncbi:MAG: PEP-utilizing enzyme [Patescibacteria group bacterium]
MAKFKNKKEIVSVASAIADLMASWKLKPDEWMIGKEMSLFFNKVISNPRQIARDTTVYILYKRLPWRCAPDRRGRVIFPPSRSKYGKQYDQFQKKFTIGLDLYPVPNNHLNPRFITLDKNFWKIGNHYVNIETPRKFLFRLRKLTDIFFKQPAKKIREFYYADKRRYHARLQLYARIEKGFKDNKLKLQMRQITRDYTKLMQRAYQELFVNERREKLFSKTLSGIVAFPAKNNITGKTQIWNEHQRNQKRKEGIFIFSHFYPADTKVLPFAKAIVVEGGGLLSHAAIVCREAKVPCLVGIRGLCAAVKAGETVEIDFTKGVVKIVT